MSRQGSLNDPTRILLTLLCTRIQRTPSLIAVIQDGGDAELKALVGLLRDGHEPPGGVMALLNALERVCAKNGVAGVLSTAKGAPFVPGLTDVAQEPNAAAGWVCPSGRCNRVVLSDEDPGIRVCAIAGDPMRAVRSA